jgi:hypothetical protein
MPARSLNDRGVLMKISEREADQALIELTTIIHQLVEKPSRKYRCEDLISAAAAFAGEACLRRAVDFDVGQHDLDPGAPVFSQRINIALCGDRSEWSDMPKASAFGRAFHVLTAESDAPWPAAAFPDVADLFRRYASARRQGIPDDGWGKMVLAVPEKSLPVLPPLSAAHEIRQKVAEHWPPRLLSVDAMNLISQLTLLHILMIVQPHIDAPIALAVAFGTMNAAAKTAPLLPTHIAEGGRSRARRA